jgi:hypothetical protein
MEKKMVKRKIDLLFIFLTGLISLFFVFDIFLNKGQPATFDGTTHITTIAQFYRGMSEGEKRVTWGDGFANYGMPIPLISQQLTPTIAASLNFIFHDVLISHNIVYFLGTFLSAVFFYVFLRIYFPSEVAFAGVYLFNFAPYRIINLYIRGAQPEFFSAVFVPLILIAVYLITKKNNAYGILLLIISVALLILTHPFMFIVSAFLFVPYTIYCLHDETERIKLILKIGISIVIGIGLTAYYTLPLFAEVKYFYYGLNESHLKPNQFLGLRNYLDPNWYYYFENDVFVRGNFIKMGLLETLLFIAGGVFLVLSIIKKQINNFLLFSVLTSILLIFLTFPQSLFFYEKISLLGGIQYPWRMLASLIFLSSIICCSILIKIKQRNTAVLFLILIVTLFKFPQVYGKNYTIYPQESYFFTTENLHGNILNTVWTGKTTEYPVKKQKPEIIEGEGNLIIKDVKNSSRNYKVFAMSDIRMADYTFYFPGWRVYVDGKETPIQFQDPSYRGVITYNVPKGDHQIFIKFENTKPRKAGYVLSIFFAFAGMAFFYFVKRNINFSYFAFPRVWRR